MLSGMVATPALVLLPGVGADHRLFARQLEVFPNLTIPPWIPPLVDESLSSYAARFAAQLPSFRPMVLGGSSFGGMLACELARIVRPDALVLIGSARSPNDMPWPLRAVAPMIRFIPNFIFSLMRRLGVLMTLPFGARSQADRDVFLAMLDDTSPAFLAWACRAMATWVPPNLDGLDVVAIHGSADLVLWAKASRSEHVVKGAGHLLPLTHSVQVNDFLRGVINRPRNKKYE